LFGKISVSPQRIIGISRQEEESRADSLLRGQDLDRKSSMILLGVSSALKNAFPSWKIAEEEEKVMTQFLARIACVSLVGLGLLSSTVAAQDVRKFEGLIKARNGDTMTLQTSDSRDLVVVLTDNTQVGQEQGLFKARRKDMSMAALIPGLKVKLEGTYETQDRVVAKSVSFKGDDLEQAQKIEAGMHETRTLAEQNKVQLEKQNAELKAQNEALQQHQQQIESNKAAIDAAAARFGQLDDYYILDEVTVYFANGKVTVDPKYTSQLLALAEKAKTVNGYMIEVKGYSSSVGSAALNQQLSEDRADAVTSILLQQGNVALTRMLAPGAMGESHPVGNNETEQGQAENRRVVVRVLQNKAVAGV
jgi:outer membrane protein OmpA-like peptidoglycan-associated protein